MNNKVREANLCMILIRSLSGLNINALKYLMPIWLSPTTGVTLRFCFGALLFWVIGIFSKPDNASARDKWLLALIGALGLYGYMFLYLMGLNYTTPVSCAIFTSMQPIWVFILSVLFMHEKVSGKKIFGIFLGFGAALLCILTQASSDLASNAIQGNMMVLGCSLLYSVYLIISGKLLKRVSNITMLQYTFLGAGIVSLIVGAFVGFDAPMFHAPLHPEPLLVMLFVLVLPTGVGYYFLPMGLKYLSPTVVAIYGYLMLVVATGVSLFLGQDRFSWGQTIAILLICFSIYWVEIAERKSNTAAPRK